MKTLLQKILGVFGYKVLTKKEYDTLVPVKPNVPKEVLLKYSEVISMLKAYDESPRMERMIEVQGFEDSRTFTFDYFDTKGYMDYMAKSAAEKGIKLKGIRFIKGVYNESTSEDKRMHGFENLLYIPTAIVNGEEVMIDVLNSSKGNLVLFKEKLEEYGYKWRYDNAKNFKKQEIAQKSQEVKQEQKLMMMRDGTDELSGSGNVTNIAPPYEAR